MNRMKMNEWRYNCFSFHFKLTLTTISIFPWNWKKKWINLCDVFHENVEVTLLMFLSQCHLDHRRSNRHKSVITMNWIASLWLTASDLCLAFYCQQAHNTYTATSHIKPFTYRIFWTFSDILKQMWVIHLGFCKTRSHKMLHITYLFPPNSNQKNK